MSLPKITPAQVFDRLSGGGYATITSDHFEYGFDLMECGVYAENLENGDYYIVTGTITNETGWLD